MTMAEILKSGIYKETKPTKKLTKYAVLHEIAAYDPLKDLYNDKDSDWTLKLQKE